MAQQTIGLGSSANDGTGDPLRDALDKANDNFGELYAIVSPPQGRLTLSTGVRVMTATVSGAGTIYYTSGRFAPIHDGTRFRMRDLGGELSQALSDNTKSPAAAAADSNYDLFLWDDSGTLRCTRGPAWSSDTARGTGAGTTEIDFTTAFPTNKVAITNGPAAGRGTYVGTIRTNGSATCDWTFGTLTSGGGAASFGVWNYYNRRLVETLVRDTDNSWTLAASSIRAANGSNAMRASFIIGVKEDPVFASYSAIAQAAASNSASIGVGFDSTSAYSGRIAHNNTASTTRTMIGDASSYLEGWHYAQALEGSHTSGTATFIGDGGNPTFSQNGLLMRMMA